MDKVTDLTAARVFVTAINKYTFKTMGREWFSLIYYKNMEEFALAFRKIHSNLDNIELVYFDYENIPSVYISLKWLSPEIFPLIRMISGLEISQQKVFSLWLSYHTPDLGTIDCETLMDLFHFCYRGKYKNKEKFAKYYAQVALNITSENNAAFDFEAFTQQLFSCEYLFLEGHVFRNNSF